MEESQVVNPLDELNEAVRNDVDGLLYLGRIDDDNIEFCGHTFGLRTLYSNEEFAAAKVVENMRNTLMEPQAWAAAQVGLALTHVDGDENFCPPIGPDEVSFARARYQYVTKNWYQPTINFLYVEFTKLLERQSEVIRSMQDLSPRSLSTFSPSQDSLNVPGISGAPIDLESLNLQS